MDQKRFSSLKNAIEPARRSLEPFRRELSEALKAYAGPHYGDSKSPDRPVNMLQLSVESFLQQLSSRSPQVLCTTHKPELRSAAIEMELALNEALKKMDFEQQHRLWVLSAIFLVGVMEVGLDVVETVEVDGEQMPVTEIFCDTIMFDDFVFDTSASRWDMRQVGFVGHKYRMTLEDARADERFDKSAREALQPIDQGRDETAKLASGDGPQIEQFTEMCEIWQIYCPRDNEVVTFSVDGGDKPLKTVKWEGPKHGPYHLLGFNPVLNNIMPLAPVANWLDLDELGNNLYKKMGKQASRQKTVTLVDNQAVTDGNNIMKAADGDVIAVGNPNMVQEVRYGGVDQQTLGFALNVRATADFVMGNLSSQMGLGASADTLGQERMIHQAANTRMASMQGVLLSATKKVLRDIAFYLHNHPTVEFDLTMDIPGMSMKIPVRWPYRDNGLGQEIDVRKGDYQEYDIDIQQYSMAEVTPGERAQLLRSIWAQDILPAIQLGVQPDVYAYLAKLGKYYNLPELSEIVKMTQEAMPPQERLAGGNAPTAGKPNGQYTRKNVSTGMTPQAMDQQREMMVMAGGTEVNQ